jgi:acyl transferase domain-containing protein
MALAMLTFFYRAPFHCSLMQEAANAMEEALKKVEIKKPIVDIVSNVTAKPVSALHPIHHPIDDHGYTYSMLSSL